METLSTAKSKHLMSVLQDQVSGGKAYPKQLQPAFYSLMHRSLPWFLIGWVLWVTQSSQMSPKFHYFLIVYSFFPLPSLNPFVRLSLPNILFALGTFQVHELCQVHKPLCKSSTSNFPLRVKFLALKIYHYWLYF